MCDCCRPVPPDGRFTVHVDTEDPTRSSTIGLTEHGLPELVVIGLHADLAAELLAAWGDYLLDEEQVLPGELLDWGPFLMEAVHVDRPSEELPRAARRFTDLRALQLVWTDDRDHWPWDPAAQRPYQPLLGSRAPWFCHEHARDRLDVPPHLP